VVYGCADSSEVDRRQGLEVAAYAKGTEPRCTQQLPNSKSTQTGLSMNETTDSSREQIMKTATPTQTDQQTDRRTVRSVGEDTSCVLFCRVTSITSGPVQWKSHHHYHHHVRHNNISFHGHTEQCIGLSG